MQSYMGKHHQLDRHDDLAFALGSLLKSRREAAGLSLTQMAARLGVSRPYLSRLERGEYEHPSPRILHQMVKHLDIRPEDLYALTGCMLPTDLPSFGPYLRAKYPDWPDLVRIELTDFYGFLKHKYSLQ